MPSLFPCSPVIRECSWKKIQIEKKIITELDKSILIHCFISYFGNTKSKKEVGNTIKFSIQKDTYLKKINCNYQKQVVENQ